MRILLTNDDGIRAPGLAAMHDALAGLGSGFESPLVAPRDTTSRSPRSVVLPIAPKTVQSATGHGITFREPLMVAPESVHPGMNGIAVDGRPADCVKLALSQLWPERFGAGSRPELLVSGINAGANCGINVIYSGTVAAALEAAFLGVPAIAVSLHLGRGKPRFDVAARHARLVIEACLVDGLPRPHECLNVNLPVTEEEAELPPISVCPMNTHGMVDQYERRESPAGDVYYWAAGAGMDFHSTEPGSDVDGLLRGQVTITPLRYDLTHGGSLERWEKRLRALVRGTP